MEGNNCSNPYGCACFEANGFSDQQCKYWRFSLGCQFQGDVTENCEKCGKPKDLH